MKRRRSNRRKTAPKAIKLPRIHLKLKWFVVPPAALATLAATLLAIEAALSLPVERLQIEGRFQRVTPLQVEEAVAAALDGGFLTANLDEIRRAVEALDWVDSVELMRVWPDTLQITLVEQQAAAHWGDSSLLNVRGELFSNDRRFGLPELPALSGPAGAEREVAERYLELRERLSLAGLALQGLAMNERGAWTIELDSGQQIRLGKGDIDARLERFFAIALPALGGELERIDYIDMRYTNGFAVAWLDELELSRANAMEVVGSG